MKENYIFKITWVHHSQLTGFILRVLYNGSMALQHRRGFTWKFFLLILLLYFGFLLLGLPLGLCRLSMSSVSLTLPLSLVGFWFLSYFVLFSPIHNLVYNQMARQLFRGQRVALCLALLTPPLTAIAYFVGGVNELMDLHEIFLIVVPALGISVLIYDVTRSAKLASVVLTVLVFPFLFVINDILFPVRVPIYYFSSTASFYVWRSLTPVLALWMTLVWASRARRSASKQETLRNFGYSLIALTLYSLTVYYLIPIVYGLRQQQPIAELILWDYWWLAYVVGAIFLFKPSKIGTQFFFVLCVAKLSYLIYQIGSYFIQLNTTYWNLSWYTHQLFAFGVFVWLLAFLRREKSLV